MPHDFFKTGPLVMSLTEAISLHLAEQLLTPLSGTYLAEGLQTILEKIRSQVPQKAMDYFAGLDETIYVRRTGMTDYSEFADTIRTLVDAAHSERTLEVRYRAIWRGAEYTTLFDPYGLVFYDGDLFAIGRSHRANETRIFKVPRIVSAVETAERFELPADFSLEGQFQSSFGIFRPTGEPVEITVRFTGGVAALVEERVWHESQRRAWQPAEDRLFEPVPDEPDALLATYRLTGLVEFKSWIMGFGRHAEVLKPTWLRQEIRDELLRAARQHGA